MVRLMVRLIVRRASGWRAIARTPVIAFAAVSIAACTRPSPTYCAEHPDDVASCGSPAGGCSDATDCSDSPATPACDLATKTCVACVANDDCPASAPVCTADRACVGCTQHADCASAACMPDGTCAPTASVAYVAPPPTGAGVACTLAAPCDQLARAVARNLPIIKIARGEGPVVDPGTITIDGRIVTIIADPGAAISVPGSDTVIAIEQTTSSASTVAIYGLTLTSTASGTNGVVRLSNCGPETSVALVGIHVGPSSTLGIVVQNGTLTVARSTIADNLIGGIQIGAPGAFSIVGNVIAGNGDSATGGINVVGQATDRIEFNTVTGNQSTAAGTPGITCSGQVHVASNIVWRNGPADTTIQTSGDCAVEYSDIGPMPLGGGNNLDVDPEFVDANASDFHIAGDSPVRRRADPAANLAGLAARDIDGEQRTAPADLGADQTP